MLKMIESKKFFLFSTRTVEAPSKAKIEKDFDSTRKFLSITDTPKLRRPTQRIYT
jgi:hypothetical protein